MLQLYNLTLEQVATLNVLWQLDSVEDVLRYRSSQPRKIQQQIDTLLEMVRLQSIDDVIDDQPLVLDTAQEMLVKIIEKNY